jgi:hypothetical protein
LFFPVEITTGSPQKADLLDGSEAILRAMSERKEWEMTREDAATHKAT